MKLGESEGRCPRKERCGQSVEEGECRQHWGGPPREGHRRLKDRGCLLFTFALFAGSCCDISLFNLKSSANFVTHPSAWCTEKRMCPTSEAIESRTETAYTGERDNPKMEPLRLQQKSELRMKWKVYTTSSRTLSESGREPCHQNYFRMQESRELPNLIL